MKANIVQYGLLALLLLCACGDDDGSPAGGGGMAVTGGMTATGGMAASNDAGGTGGIGGGGTSGSSAEYERCQEPVIDPGEDDCLACALEHCCRNVGGTCLSPSVSSGNRVDGGSACYERNIQGCVLDCFVETTESEPETPSWYVVAGCVDSCESESEERSFPRNTTSVGTAVECIVGSLPDDESMDADAGDLLDCDTEYCYARSPCAEVCFPGWH